MTGDRWRSYITLRCGDGCPSLSLPLLDPGRSYTTLRGGESGRSYMTLGAWDGEDELERAGDLSRCGDGSFVCMVGATSYTMTSSSASSVRSPICIGIV